MERHLDECVECRRAFAGLTAVVDALHRIPVMQPAYTLAQLAVSVRARLDEPPHGVS
jgi:hypothetical protein